MDGTDTPEAQRWGFWEKGQRKQRHKREQCLHLREPEELQASGEPGHGCCETEKVSS
jgi:hypothetical protein